MAVFLEEVRSYGLRMDVALVMDGSGWFWTAGFWMWMWKGMLMDKEMGILEMVLGGSEVG
jgi:hypothetical protein